MIEAIPLQQLALEIGAELHASSAGQANTTFDRVSTDTRAIQAGDLFVALRGENFDAHNFLSQAAENKACGLVVEQVEPSVALPQLVVADTTRALGQIGAVNRSRYRGPLLAITGSGGKTTVKGMAASILSQCGKTLATRGNLNNHIGVPLTLLELEAGHEFAVIEMGASAGGEIAYLVGLAKPDVAMVNNVMPAHVEGFGSVGGIAKAKGEIYQGLSAAGIAVLNLDEIYVQDWRERLPCERRLTFSLANPEADVYVQRPADDLSQGLVFTLVTPQGSTDVSLPIIGKHNINNALAAATCALAMGADLEAIANGLQAFRGEKGRMQLLQGLAGAVLIDDSYNANPGSVRAAIDTLVNYPGKRILVLGDLAELGEEAPNLHAELGDYARWAGVDRVVTVGPLTRHLNQAFGAGASHCADHSEAIDIIKTELDADTAVLVKGSRSARMEVVVQAINERGDKTQC